MSAIAATPRAKAIQRATLAMSVLAGVINHINRATLAVANPLIHSEPGLSIAGMSCLPSPFLGAVDKLASWLLLMAGLALRSAAQSLGDLMSTFGQFFGA